jgi:RNA polymerase sigma factor (sigma-70 family)
VLLRLWAELVAGRSIEQPKAWAFRAIYRLAMDQHRLQRRIGSIAERLGRSDAADVGRDTSDRIAVWAEVARLPDRQRHVLYLRYRADLSFEEIASVMGITASAARSHATQATATLRRRLGDESDEVVR